MIYIGENNIKIFIGEVPVNKVYIGEEQVYTNKLKELNFTVKSSTANIRLQNSDNTPDVEYSTDGLTWTAWDYSAISLNSGDTIYFRGDNPLGFSRGYLVFSTFIMNGEFEGGGSVMSLIDKDGYQNLTGISADYCFYRIFSGCGGLTKAPELPAKTLSNHCYYAMFVNCSGLTETPNLPAKTLASNCYNSMFGGCSNLTSIKKLKATTIPKDAYYAMFNKCTSLTTVPIDLLPATTLNIECYGNMFEGCPNLTTAPELPAATLVDYCYERMFSGCTSLNEIKCYALDISATGCTKNWVSNVSNNGTFYYDYRMRNWTTGVCGIPEGWTQIFGNLKELAFNALSTGATIALTTSSSPNVQYSTDGGLTWINWDYSPISVPQNSYVLFRGNNAGGFANNRFVLNGEFTVGGNIMYLIDYSGSSLNVTNNCFAGLFQDCTGLTSIEYLKMPATGLSNDCYGSMFKNCENLTTAPIDLLQYEGVVPMGGYSGMFSNCKNLTQAPELPNVQFTSWSMNGMYEGCEKLNYIKNLHTGGTNGSATYYWVDGVAQSGVFVKSPNGQWYGGENGIPNGWVVLTGTGVTISATIDGVLTRFPSGTTAFELGYSQIWNQFGTESDVNDPLVNGWIYYIYDPNIIFYFDDNENSCIIGSTIAEFAALVGTDQWYIEGESEPRPTDEEIMENCYYYSSPHEEPEPDPDEGGGDEEPYEEEPYEEEPYEEEPTEE